MNAQGVPYTFRGVGEELFCGRSRFGQALRIILTGILRPYLLVLHTSINFRTNEPLASQSDSIIARLGIAYVVLTLKPFALAVRANADSREFHLLGE